MIKREIAEQNCILKAIVGSSLHGLALEGQDDRDEMGVCVEPPEYVIGLEHFDQWIFRTKPEGVRSGPGDVDRVIYSLRKWCHLALGGNPTILLLLFVPPAFTVTWTKWGEQLQSMASCFIARTVAKPYYGYMEAQRQRLIGERGQKRVKRPELEAQFGFDTKYAAHMIRLGLQGMELIQTGRLTLPMHQTDREKVLRVRRGELDLHEVLTWAGELQRDLREAENTSPLPEKPDADAVNRFLCEAYQAYWRYQERMYV